MFVNRLRLHTNAFRILSNHKLSPISPRQSITIHSKPYVTEVFSSISGIIQDYVTGMHHMTALPWWATIAASTGLVRLALFPIVRFQYIHASKLAVAMPELNFLAQLLSHRLHGMKRSSPKSNLLSIMCTTESYRLFGIFFKGVRSCLETNNVQMSYILGLPFFNLVTFITFVHSLRLMIRGDLTETIQEGGLSWFSNLQVKDDTFLLPFAALALTYSAIELSFYIASHTKTAAVSSTSTNVQTGGKYVLIFKNVVQSLVILIVPLALPLPTGVFFYWIPSSLMTSAQILLMRTEWFRKLVRVPPSLKPPAPKVSVSNDNVAVKNVVSNSSGSNNSNSNHINSSNKVLTQAAFNTKTTSTTPSTAVSAPISTVATAVGAAGISTVTINDNAEPITVIDTNSSKKSVEDDSSAKNDS